MTTHKARTVQSIDTREFRMLLADLFDAGDLGEDAYSAARVPLIEHINAWGAAQREEGSRLGSEYQNKVEEKKIERLRSRATSAEAKLAEVEDAARNLLAYLDRHGWGLVPEGQTGDKLRDLVSAAKSDESGLPG